MWRRILAILAARNREFYRERAGLGWNIFMLILMILALAFIFRGDPEDLLKVGVYRGDAVPAAAASPFLATRHVTFIPMLDRTNAILKVERHQLDLLLDLSGAPDYWVNLHSPRGYVAERVLLGPTPHRPGDKLRSGGP